MPWYRQYFWLLLFGGIIILVAIISFAVICACTTRLSKSVFRIQKSLKRKKGDTSTIVTENSINYSSGQSKVKLPNRTERDFAVSEIPITVMPPKIYAVIQKGSPQLPPRGLFISEIPSPVLPPKMHAMIQKESPQLPPRGLYPKHNAKEENTNSAVSEIPITVMPPKIYAMIQKGSPQLPPRGLYPKHNAKKENTNSAISENPIIVLPQKINAMVHMGPPRVPPWGLYPEYNGKSENTNSHTPNPNDRYSNASYDSVGSISGYSNYSDSAAADPEYNGKTKNTNSHTPNPNDRYSSQSYDSVGSISGYSNYSDSTAAAFSKEREYLEVIPDVDDGGYDDVEIISSESDISYRWNNKP
ncbi:uncharacterized protein LOC120926585 isoform X5 [Rana temporaria]|uniref:uncharacterized protein LOC120926585 isoform X5 n=1 Tax=Rana temporaria TaxID=8407 RepID=UPI001AAD6F2D|nr:uncharacterized protein LOC120926585 isoform X5 [Rana temporaria]